MIINVVRRPLIINLIKTIFYMHSADVYTFFFQYNCKNIPLLVMIYLCVFLRQNLFRFFIKQLNNFILLVILWTFTGRKQLGLAWFIYTSFVYFLFFLKNHLKMWESDLIPGFWGMFIINLLKLIDFPSTNKTTELW